MGKIIIKRGLQENVTNLVLQEGELAVALDTGNVYIGTTSGVTHINPAGGTADEAVKLKNAREFSITGDATSTIATFNGTQNVQLAVSLATMAGLTAGSYSKLTVDTKGRVTGATNITVADLPTVPTSKISGLGAAATLDTGVTAGKVVVVGPDGKLPESIMPALSINDIFEAADQAAMLALNAQTGDICIRSDESKSYVLSTMPATVLANWRWLKTPDSQILTVNGKSGVVSLNATDVGAEPVLSGASIKATIANTDTVIIQDSEATGTTKKITWTNLKSALKTYFDGLYNKYVHPTFTAAENGLYKTTISAEGHVTATTPVTKEDIVSLGIPAVDTVYSLPTASAAVKGGFRVGSGLTMTSDILSVSDIDGGTF